MKRISKLIVSIILAIVVNTLIVFAANDANIIEINDGGDNPVLFIKGIEGEVSDVSAIIGNTEANASSYGKLVDSDAKINTLILIDNSISIPENARNVISEMLLDFVASRSNNDYYAVVTFSENVDTNVEFSNDYAAIKSVIEGITYQDQETYLTDVLYEILNSKMFDDTQIDYNRILVISDGVDNKSVGITSDELKALIDEKSIPVYTLGMYNKKKSNTTQLENMFAISRQSNADSFLLDELENINMVEEALNADRNIVYVQLDAPDAVKDGSQKAITISLNAGGQEYTAKANHVQMIQVAIKEEKVEEPIEPQTETKPVVQPTAEETVEQPQSKTPILPIIIGVIVALVAIGAGVFFFLKKKKDDEIKTFDILPKDNTDPWDLNSDLDDTTVQLWSGGTSTANSDEDVTIGLFPEKRSCYINLIDMQFTGKSYKKAISNGRTLIIGRNADVADIAIPDPEKGISKKHCQIEMRGDRFYLTDLMAPNKTYLNEMMIVSETEISNGAILKLGRREFKVEIG